MWCDVCSLWGKPRCACEEFVAVELFDSNRRLGASQIDAPPPTAAATAASRDPPHQHRTPPPIFTPEAIRRERRDTQPSRLLLHRGGRHAARKQRQRRTQRSAARARARSDARRTKCRRSPLRPLQALDGSGTGIPVFPCSIKPTSSADRGLFKKSGSREQQQQQVTRQPVFLAKGSANPGHETYALSNKMHVYNPINQFITR